MKAGRVIRDAFASLADLPQRGVALEVGEEREVFLRFCRGGYVVRYVVQAKAVVVTGVWHTLEDRPRREP